MKYKVYALTLNKTGEVVYIGQTRQSLNKRLISHRTLGRFPTKDFSINLIASFEDIEPMYQLETILIDQLNMVNIGWNKEYGKRKIPKQTSQSGSNNQFYGHSHRDEIRKAIGQRSIGNKYAKGSKSRKGLKNSERHNLLISIKNSKKVYCKKLDFVFFSCKNAAEYYGLNATKVAAVCRGVRKTTKGYSFTFYTTGQSV